MVSNIKNNAEEKQPLLTPDVTSGPQTPTKTILLPLAMFLYTIGRDLGSTATKQFVNNYTKSAHHGDLNSTSLQMFNDSQQSCNINASTSKDTDKKEAADWLLYFELTEYFFGLPVIIMAGIYSDFYGRRIFSLIPVIGASIQWIILFGIVYFEFRVEYIFVAYGICGISGSHYTFNLNMASSIADTTGTGKSRSFHMTILHVYMGIGETLSSLGSGFLIQHMGYGVPCAISSALCLIASVFLYNTPETLTAKLRSEKPQFCETFMRFFGFFFGIGLNKKSDRWIFILTLVAFLFVLSPETQASSLATLYILGAPLCFSSEMLGYYNASSDFLHLVLGAAILKLFHCCMYDEAVVIISLLVSGVSYMVVLAFATYTWMIFLGVYVGELSWYTYL